MTRNEAPATTKQYTLNSSTNPLQQQTSLGAAFKRLAPLMFDEKRSVVLAFLAVIVNSGSTLLGPVIIGRTVDVYIGNKDFNGVLMSAAVLLVVYICGLFASY